MKTLIIVLSLIATPALAADIPVQPQQLKMSDMVQPHQLMPPQKLAARHKPKPHNPWINPNDFPNGPLPVQPPPTPVVGPTPISPTNGTPLENLFAAIAQVQAKIVADLNTAYGLASTPIPNQTAAACDAPGVWTPEQPGIPATNTTLSSPAVPGFCTPAEVWDPLGAACFPAMVTFIQTLPGAQLPTTPPGAQGGLVTAAEDVRLIDFAVKQFAAQIGSVGYPNSLKIACDPWILDWVTQANLDIASVAKLGTQLGGGLMTGVLLKFVPLPLAGEHGLAAYRKQLGD